MEKLPVEIVERMLVDPQLTVADVLNVADTCTRLHKIVWDNNHFWRRKYEIMWPQLMKLFSDDSKEWFKEVIYIHKLTKLVYALLHRMCTVYLHEKIMLNDNFREWTMLLEESPRTYEYVALDFINIINNNSPIKTIEAVPLDTPGNNTLKYYATKALIFIRQQHLRKMWLTFMDNSKGLQILEYAATFLAQWCQPPIDIQMDDIGKQLDDIANRVIKQLKVTHPMHPLHKVPLELLHKWKNLNLNVNYWNRKDCYDIIHCMVDVVRNNFQLHVNYNIALENNYFINKVLELKTGLPIILSIIYHAVARRLGVRTILISSMNTYCYLEIHEFKDQEFRELCRVDVFKQGKIIFSSSEQLDIPHGVYIPLSAKKVAERIGESLVKCCNHSKHSCDTTNVRTSLELMQLLRPNEPSILYSLAQLYIRHGAAINTVTRYVFEHDFPNPAPVHVFGALQEANDPHRNRISIYQGVDRRLNLDGIVVTKGLDPSQLTLVKRPDPLKDTVPKQRPKDLQYAVGMIMKHQKLNYVCIIYDWDPTYVNGRMQMENEVPTQKQKSPQPFYKVMADGNAYYYVAEEDLKPATELFVLPKNQGIGRYFSHFFGTHYVPNMIVEKLFPEDRAVRHSFHYNFK